MMTIERLEKDGLVAVVYSPGFGAGWSTWNSEQGELLALDKDIAQAVMDGDLKRAAEIAKQKAPDTYLGGADDLTIRWIPKGTAFHINEYDGNESVEIIGEISYYIA
jgi:hypothetical protein